MRIKTGALILFISFLAVPPPAFARGSKTQIVSLKPVTVTATRLPSEGSFYSLRSVDSDPSIELTDTLIDVRTRGPKGIQEDLSIRASTFEETLVLLNGLRINDPQTGHFTMDIPLTTLDIDNIDIVYGPSSAFYGSSGIGGTINVLARPPSDKPTARAILEGGSYDYYLGAASLDIPMGIIKNKVSLEASRSSGYMAETEFDRLVINANSNISFKDGYVDFMFGWLKKDFGADSFYSDLYNNEEEHTDTRLFKLDMGYTSGDVTLRPVFYYRRHWDKFILDRNRCDWSKNFHKNYMYGGELTATMETGLGDLAYGVDLGWEEIDSTSLNNHSRNRQAVFFEDRLRLGSFLFNIGLRLDRYSSFGTEFNPEVAAAYFVNDSFKLRVSSGRGFRAPSFTELYYRTAANVGNPDLKPETAWSFDAGADYRQKGIDVSVTSFMRLTSDIIDWTRTGSSAVWNSDNIGEFDVYGFEGILRFRPCEAADIPNFKRVQVRYGYTESFKHEGIISKYVLNYLMHDLVSEIEYELPWGIRHMIRFSLKKRIGEDHYMLLDSELYKDIEIRGSTTRLFVRGDNLTNTDYTENGSVRMPGIWITAGLNFEF